MKKFLKILFSTLLVVILLIVIAAVVLPFVIDPNDFKPQITAQVEKATGRELTLGGDIKLSVFPWLGVDLKDVSLSNAPGFGKAPFAKVSDMEVRVKLIPLLEKQLVMDTVVLNGLDLNLARNAQGKTNWADLAAGESQQISSEEETAPEGESPPPLAGIAIAGLKIEAARIDWRDEVKDVRYTIKKLNLDTDPLVPGEPTQIKLDFDFAASQPDVHGHLDLSGKVTADMEANHYLLQNTDLKLTAAGPALPIEQLALQLNADIDAFLAKQQLTVSDLKFTSQVKGEQEVQLTLNTSLEGNLAAQQYRLNNLQVETQVATPQFPEPINATLATTASLDLNRETLTLQDLSLATLGIKLKGQIKGAKILTDPKLKGQLVSNAFNPRRAAETLALELPPTSDESVLDKAQLALKFSASPQDFNAKTLVAKLDDSTLKGTMAVHNFQQPAIRFDLALDAINLDRYLPPPSEKAPQAPPPTSPGGAAAGAAGLPLDALRALNASGTFRIGKLTVSGVRSEGIRITLAAKDGLVKLHPLSAKLYQGSYTGNIRLDARNTPPQLAIDEKLAGIKAGPLLQDLTGDGKITGTANINADLTATGATPKAIQRTLNGTAGFSFTDGAVKGINIARLIREAKATLEGKQLPPNREPEQTDFALLEGTITATNGILKNNDLKAQSPFLRVKGQGSANLVQENLDYQLKVAIVKTPKGQGGKSLAKLKGITIPIKISGTFTQPEYGIDLESLIKARAGKLIEENKQNIQKELEKNLDKFLGTESDQGNGETPPSPEQQLKEELKNKLKGIF
ncbi:AsmA family protein [Nitrosococcus watsonii]|uniref:AsmA family protein n=1 Tax=Nitrosococcus watsoni (strain C-113) TaxID=105559 RepID=D8K7Q3_NITWC|nr:AsmA family protein [Nitrosococcus watsonii]ADJ28930.1 AsmA family protein [Nitrosococcus watsonii C-113]